MQRFAGSDRRPDTAPFDPWMPSRSSYSGAVRDRANLHILHIGAYPFLAMHLAGGRRGAIFSPVAHNQRSRASFTKALAARPRHSGRDIVPRCVLRLVVGPPRCGHHPDAPACPNESRHVEIPATKGQGVSSINQQSSGDGRTRSVGTVQFEADAFAGYPVQHEPKRLIRAPEPLKAGQDSQRSNIDIQFGRWSDPPMSGNPPSLFGLFALSSPGVATEESRIKVPSPESGMTLWCAFKIAARMVAK